MKMTRKKRAPKRRAAERHANRYDGLTWCDARVDWSWAMLDDGLDVVGMTEPPADLDDVSCVECLRRIVAYGELAGRRLQAVADLAEKNPQKRP